MHRTSAVVGKGQTVLADVAVRLHALDEIPLECRIEVEQVLDLLFTPDQLGKCTLAVFQQPQPEFFYLGLRYLNFHFASVFR